VPLLPPMSRRFNSCNMFAMILETSKLANEHCIMARLASWILVRIYNPRLIIERDCAHQWHAPFLKRILMTNRS
jgi:hypothetical protein